MAISTAVDASAVARVVGIETNFVDLRQGGIFFLPQRVAIFGQGSTGSVYSTDKRQITSAFEAGSVYGFGSPIHLVAQQLYPLNGDGVGSVPVTVYPLEDDASGVAAVGDITPSGASVGAGSFRVKVNEKLSAQFVIASGDSVATQTAAITAAIASVIDYPMTAADGTTVVNLTAKWKGASGNDLNIEVVETSLNTTGVTFAITQPAGGLVNPNIDDALAQIGNVWETFIINCFDIADTTTLDKFQTFGDGRWGALVHSPLAVVTGNTATTVANATVISDARKTDRVNFQITSPATKELPFVLASRAIARIARVANNNPPVEYAGNQLTGLVAGSDGDQWNYNEMDTAVKAGSSTTLAENGVITLKDTVTFYHPDGDPLPAYRHVVDIVKLQNILYNISLIFNAAPYIDGVLLPSGQPTINPKAVTPETAKADVYRMLDSLALNALISDADFAKDNTVTEIDAQNPKRLNVSITLKLSGNTNIISTTLNWGFYFGGNA